MFHSISWQSYWTAIAVVSLVYYIIVYALYFKMRLGAKTHVINSYASIDSAVTVLNTDDKGSVLRKAPSPYDEEAASEFVLPEENTKERTVYSCMDEVKAFMEEAKKVHWEKDALLFALTSILQKYPSIKGSSYEQSVTNVLRTECEHHCSLHLSAEELAQAWLGV